MYKSRLRATSLLIALIYIVVLLSSCAVTDGGDVTGNPIFVDVPTSNITEPQTEPATAAPTEEPTEPVTDPPTEPVTTSPPEPVTDSVSFIACGDSIIYLAGIYDAENRAVAGGRKYNFRAFYRNVEERIAAADIAFINQETVMAGDGYKFSGYPAFNSPRELALDLIDVGFDVISLANNHMLDKGSAGLISTLDYWNTLPVTTVGGYLGEDDAANIRVIEKNGVRIAFVAFTYWTNYDFDGNKNLSIPYLYSKDNNGKLVFSGERKAYVNEQINAARLVGDVVIVSTHWGDENVLTPNALQKEAAQFISDCGADVIIGHHPHVLQPIEWITSSDGNHKTLCAYSLGNFSANMGYDYNALGGMLSFNIKRTVYPDGREPDTLEIVDPVFHPTVNYFDVKCYNNEIFYINDFTSAMCASHGVVTRRAAGNTNYGGVMTLTRLFGYLDKTVIDLCPAVYTSGRPS